MTYPRPLSSDEIIVLDRFATLLGDQADVFRRQLRLAFVTREDIGHLRFSLPQSAPRFTASETELDGYYDDFDGMEIVLTVHLLRPPGKISWLERFRSDGQELEKRWPKPDEVVFHRPIDDQPSLG